uniref:Dimer_Tnp_hAT domain-containing protein n=1 Tax=Rhabditophanes sp. KR3021 TaxID=114890 RepID=A0AC35TK01_9BILA
MNNLNSSCGVCLSSEADENEEIVTRVKDDEPESAFDDSLLGEEIICLIRNLIDEIVKKEGYLGKEECSVTAYLNPTICQTSFLTQSEWEASEKIVKDLITNSINVSVDENLVSNNNKNPGFELLPRNKIEGVKRHVCKTSQYVGYIYEGCFENPTSFWLGKGRKELPQMSDVAFNYCTLPGSSVGCERVGSYITRLLTANRSSLKA